MTDEQWLWLYVNWSLDSEEQLDRMCPKCRQEAADDTKCMRCGSTIHKDEEVTNPKFDVNRFNELLHGSGETNKL